MNTQKPGDGCETPHSALISALVAVGLSFWCGDALLVARGGADVPPPAALILLAWVGASLVGLGLAGLWSWMKWQRMQGTDGRQSGRSPVREHALSSK